MLVVGSHGARISSRKRPAADRGKYFARVDDSPNGATNDIFTHRTRAHFSLLKKKCLKPIISKKSLCVLQCKSPQIGTMPPMIFVPLASHFHQAAVQAGNLDFIHYFAVANEGNGSSNLRQCAQWVWLCLKSLRSGLMAVFSGAAPSLRTPGSQIKVRHLLTL